MPFTPDETPTGLVSETGARLISAARRLRRRVSAWTLAAALAVCLGMPGNADAQPLDQELRALLNDYPAIGASQAEIDARKEDTRSVAAGNQPQITGTAELGPERTDQPTDNQIRKVIGLSATYNLYDANSTDYLLEASRGAEKQGRSDLAALRNRVLLDGISGYLNVVQQEQLVRLAERNVSIVTSIADYVARERKNGRMTLADSLQSRARLQQAEEARIAFKGALQQAEDRYRKLFRHAPDIDTMQDPVVPFASMPKSAKDAVRIALERNPEIDSARRAIDVANARRLAAGAGDKPRFDLTGSVDSKHDYDGVQGSQNEGSLLVTMNWNLFDGMRTDAQRMAAANRQTAALDALHQRKIDIEERVSQTWHRVDTSARRLETLVKAEKIALEAYNARYKLMTAGSETIINVLDTSLEVLNVRTALIRVDYRHRLAAYQLLNATGQLTPDSLDRIIAVEPLKIDAIDRLPANPREQMAGVSNAADTQVTTAPAPAPAPANNAQNAAQGTPPPLPDDIMSLTPNTPVEPTPPADTLRSADLAAAPGSSPTHRATAPIDMSNAFYVVLSANRNAANAERDARKLHLEGARVKTFSVGGKPMHMVVVGPLPEPEARVVQGEALAAGVLDAWLKKL